MDQSGSVFGNLAGWIQMRIKGFGSQFIVRFNFELVLEDLEAKLGDK